MRERRRRGWVCQVVGWYVHSLNGGDRTRFGGSDALLQNPHLSREGGLVTHCGGHTAQQCRYFRTRQCIAIDVVDEQEHVTPFIAKLFGQREPGETHSESVPRRLVHLPEYQRNLIEHTRLFHLVVEVVAFPGTLTDTGKNR